ncbi:uncharacterized protein An09g03150 [Aspergillus niger]|uniref:Contig An09c0080, genomic contig n=2 Tax=Aspergillus niger TaxID=5061 RepID=A2QTS9_ASPNC|nr:uncharacterized protein An09g03150 [Aspergillus niger]CAK40254.1 unnamed protein product [Aspergillus niger]
MFNGGRQSSDRLGRRDPAERKFVAIVRSRPGRFFEPDEMNGGEERRGVDQGRTGLDARIGGEKRRGMYRGAVERQQQRDRMGEEKPQDGWQKGSGLEEEEEAATRPLTPIEPLTALHLVSIALTQPSPGFSSHLPLSVLFSESGCRSQAGQEENKGWLQWRFPCTLDPQGWVDIDFAADGLLSSSKVTTNTRYPASTKC